MAKKSLINRNNNRLRLIEKHRARRGELKAVLSSRTATSAEKAEALRGLERLPRDSSPVRYRNRCGITGRPRGTFRKFGLGRNVLRKFAMSGEIPGVTKSSW